MFKKVRFASTSEVVPNSATDDNEIERNELLTRLDLNVRCKNWQGFVDWEKSLEHFKFHT